jgi:hypothetical protein
MRLSLTSRPSTMARRRGPALWITRPHIGKELDYECRPFQLRFWARDKGQPLASKGALIGGS